MVDPRADERSAGPDERLKTMVEVSRLERGPPLVFRAVRVTVCTVPDTMVAFCTLTVDFIGSKEAGVTVTVGKVEVTAVPPTLALTVAGVPGVPPVSCTV